MNNSRKLSANNSSEELPLRTMEQLITNGLGYCCEWFFLELYDDAELIALRLGISIATVQRHQLWKRRGKMTCKECKSCKKAIIENFETKLNNSGLITQKQKELT